MIEEISSYLEKLNNILEKYKIKVVAKMEFQDNCSLLLQNEDYQDLIVRIEFSEGSCNLKCDNNSSEIYQKILPEVLKMEGKFHADYNSCLGTDESGKGDYFGPLVIAGFISDNDANVELAALGVKDSKKLTDNEVITLSEKIKEKFYDRYSILSLEPKKYNEMYSLFKLEGKNMNHLLSWGHLHVIETLLNKETKVDSLIIDRFGKLNYVDDISRKYEGINIINEPHSENEMAVAAASIIARGTFLKWLNEKSKETSIKLYKGADTLVHESALEIIGKYGIESLIKYVKIHFKTTQIVIERYKNEK